MKCLWKKSGCILLSALILLIALTGCGKTDASSTNSTASAQGQTNSVQSGEAYQAFLKDLYDTSSETERAYTSYYIRDLDNNGVDELMTFHEGLEMTVYTYDNGVKKLDFHDFATGTTRLFCSEVPSYPGFFEFHVGGGLEQYNYITLKNNALSFEKLWDDDFSDSYESRPKIVEYVTDQQMIAESKRLYQENKDIEFLPLESVLTK